MSGYRRVSAGVIGASGYAGGELCRLLLGHPNISRIMPSARGEMAFERVHPNLLGSGLEFYTLSELKDQVNALDVVFFCTPSGEAMKHAAWFLANETRVIDLSADFRFREPEMYHAVYGAPHTSTELLARAAYGVTELCRDDIAQAQLIANPGCYVITAILALTPILRADLADLKRPVHISAVNGTTGAGNKPRVATMHAQALDSMLPYTMEGHRHGPELEVHLASQAGHSLTVDFNTAHGNFARGIYLQANLSVQPDMRNDLTRERILDVLGGYYGRRSEGAHFVRIVDFPKNGKINEKEYDIYPSLTAVKGSNFVHIGADYDANRGTIKLLAVTDNLVKGAAGSAIQNMNVMLGLDETAGLTAYGFR